MSKKRFTDSLNDLFADTATDEQRVEEESLLSLPDRRKEKISPPKPNRQSGKNFSDSLDLFLQEALDQPTGPIESSFEVPSELGTRKRKTSYGQGLNALLRDTTEDKPGLPKERARRLTLIISRDELDELRAISKKQQVPLKEMVLDIIADYIRNKRK